MVVEISAQIGKLPIKIQGGKYFPIKSHTTSFLLCC